MLSTERQQTIARLVAEHGAVDVADLAVRLAVSGSTIRRDLERLERDGLVRRVHGGATVPGGMRPLQADRSRAAERMGRAAANRVRSDETVYLGPGEYSLEVAKALSGRPGVTVVTNSLDISHWLAHHSNLKVVVTGGAVNRSQGALFGPLVSAALASVRTDRVIVEAVGITPDQGIVADDLSQAAVCRDLMEVTGESIVLVPPDRVGKPGGVWVGPASDADVVVTTREAPGSLLWDLSQMGIDIVTV